MAFTLSQDFAHSGSNSALLRMRDPADVDGSKVYYLVQEIAPGTFPEVVRGYYRVENWQKNTLRLDSDLGMAVTQPLRYTPP